MSNASGEGSVGLGCESDGDRFLTKLEMLGEIGGGDRENERGGDELAVREGERAV